MTMSHGLEARVPFLDYRLIETANKIHPNVHLQNNGKNILKIIAKEFFPKSFINREKGYFPMPALKYIKGKYYDFVYDILNSLSCKNRGLFNRNYVDNLLKFFTYALPCVCEHPNPIKVFITPPNILTLVIILYMNNSYNVM